jgi:hypothetical protein
MLSLLCDILVLPQVLPGSGMLPVSLVCVAARQLIWLICLSSSSRDVPAVLLRNGKNPVYRLLGCGLLGILSILVNSATSSRIERLSGVEAIRVALRFPRPGAQSTGIRQTRFR